MVLRFFKVEKNDYNTNRMPTLTRYCDFFPPVGSFVALDEELYEVNGLCFQEMDDADGRDTVDILLVLKDSE